MKESVTYQAIIEEGRIEGIRIALLILGRHKFGTPDRETEAALRSIEDQERLERMGEKLLDAKSWQELLAVQ